MYEIYIFRSECSSRTRFVRGSVCMSVCLYVCNILTPLRSPPIPSPPHPSQLRKFLNTNTLPRELINIYLIGLLPCPYPTQACSGHFLRGLKKLFCLSKINKYLSVIYPCYVVSTKRRKKISLIFLLLYIIESFP